MGFLKEIDPQTQRGVPGCRFILKKKVKEFALMFALVATIKNSRSV